VKHPGAPSRSADLVGIGVNPRAFDGEETKPGCLLRRFDQQGAFATVQIDHADGPAPLFPQFSKLGNQRIPARVASRLLTIQRRAKGDGRPRRGSEKRQ